MSEEPKTHGWRRLSEVEPKQIPGTPEDYWAMLHALLKTLALHASDIHWPATPEETRHVKQALAQWTRGIYDTAAGRHVSADIERLLKVNRVADSLEELWKWYDDPNT